MRQILEVSNTNEKASRWLALWKPAVAVGVAATLIIALLIGGVFSSGTPAYAVEQTVKSIHAIRFVNFDISVEQMPAFSEKFWTELDETGNIRRARISVSGDGAAGVEALWQGDQFELWDKQANTHFINFKDRAKTEGFRQPANGLNPAHIIDELIQQQEKGNLQFVTEQPKNTNEPIILKATWSKPEQDRPEYDVLKIDPKTYLPTQLYRHNMKNGQNQYSITIHYQYPEKVDPAVFKLQVPANVPLQNGNFRPAK